MEVSTSYALEQARERFAQLRQQLASQTTQQRLTDMSGLKPVENAPLPALAQLRWPAMDVEHSREMLGGTQARRDLTNQSIEDCSKSIKTAEALIAKYGPISPLCAMMESAKSALQSLAAELCDEEIEIDRLTTELNEKIAAPAYQQWLSRLAQAGQVSNAQDPVSGAQDPAAPTVNAGSARLSVVC